MPNKERIEKLERLSKDEFLIEASSLLNESSKDPEITPEEHKELFDAFVERAGELFPDPSRSESTRIRQIAFTQHSKE